MSRPRLAVLAAALLASCGGPTLVMAQIRCPSPSPQSGGPDAVDAARYSTRVVSRIDTRRLTGVSGFRRDSWSELTLARPKS